MKRPGLWLLAGIFAVLPQPGVAALRAVVIGVNAYRYETPLQGSVNDADAVAAAIAPLAAGVTRLTDGQAQRRAVLQALAGALAASTRGDTLFVSYSGHGGRERVRVTPETPTGFREFWVMADFDRRTPQGRAERVLSSEIGAWVAQARAAGVRVVLLADHCYSGKIYRGVGVDIGNIRRIPVLTGPDADSDAKTPALTELAAAPPPPGLVSLAADTSDKPVAEFRITAVDRVHGALSYAFARALGDGRGDVDPGHGGRITVAAMRLYLQRAVNVMSDGQQYPQLRSGDPPDEVLFTLPDAAAVPPAAAVASPPPIALHLAGLPAGEGEELVAGIGGARWEPDPAHARLVWRRRGGAGLQATGPLVTGLNMFVSFDLPAGELAAAVETTAIADTLAARAGRGHLEIAIARRGGGGAPVYFSGEELTLAVHGLPGPHLAVFDLTAGGQVQTLYPTAQDPPAVPPGGAVEVLRMRVTPDYGGDHVVAVAGRRPLAGLIAMLGRHPAAAAAGAAVLAALAADPAAEVAVAGLFTADAARRCDPEIVRDAAMAAACAGGRP